MKSYLKVIQNALFKKRLIIYTCIPILCCFVITLIINFLYSGLITERTLNELSSKLNYATSQLDKIYSSSVSTIGFLVEDSNVNKLLRTREKLSPAEFRDISQVVSKTLGYFQNIDSVNDDVIIYFRKYQSVVTKNGVHTADSYFNISQRYHNYPKAFWDVFKSQPFRYKLLNLSMVSTGDRDIDSSPLAYLPGVKPILPFVWQDLEGPPEGGLVIANIDMRKIISQLSKSSIFENADVFISDTQQNIYTANESDYELANEISELGLVSDQLHTRNIGGKKYFIYSKQSEFAPFSQLGYTVYVDSALATASLNSFNQLMGLVMFGSFLLTVVTVLFLFNKIHSPLSMFTSQVDSYIKLLDVDVNEEDDKLGALNSLAQNYFFTHLLSWENCYSRAMLDNLLHDLKISFSHEKFIVVMTNYLLTQSYHDSFGSEGQKIISRLNTIMSAILPDGTISYPILLNNHQLCIVVNCDASVTPGTLKEVYRNFLQSLTHDSEYINIQITLSQEKDKLTDIHQAYIEARNTMLLLTPFQLNTVAIYGEHSEFQTHELSTKTAEALFTALGARNKEKCFMILKEIFQSNKSATQPAFRTLCLRVYSIFAEVLHNRGSTPREIMGDDYMNIDILVYELPPEEVWAYVEKFCGRIAEDDNKHKKYNSIDIENVLEHIDQNYADSNLSLLSLAEVFDVTDRYISKFIAEKSGTNFLSYLTRRRIEVAKILLRESDIKINDLLVKVGFSNRNTFLRAFRKLTGLSPTEYRASFPEASDNKTKD